MVECIEEQTVARENMLPIPGEEEEEKEEEKKEEVPLSEDGKLKKQTDPNKPAIDISKFKPKVSASVRWP
eukprot:1003656-Prorocentrum_minimum.AAC.2